MLSISLGIYEAAEYHVQQHFSMHSGELKVKTVYADGTPLIEIFFIRRRIQINFVVKMMVSICPLQIKKMVKNVRVCLKCTCT